MNSEALIAWAVCLDVFIAIAASYLVHKTPIHKPTFVLFVCLAIKYVLYVLGDIDHYVDFIGGFDITGTLDWLYCRLCGSAGPPPVWNGTEIAVSFMPRILLLFGFLYTIRTTARRNQAWRQTPAGQFFKSNCR